MFEFLTGVYFSWYFIAFAIVLVFTTLHNDAEAWAGTFTVIAALAFFGKFDVEWMTLSYLALAWIPLGVAWSLWRFRKYTNNLMADVDLKGIGSGALQNLKFSIRPSNNVGKIVGWIFAWPFSFIENILSDLFDLISSLVKTYLIGLYNHIVKGHMTAITDAQKETNSYY